MNALSTLGSYFQPQTLSPSLGRSLANAGQQRASSQVPARQSDSRIASPDAVKTLGSGDAATLLKRAGDLGSATIEAAKKFVTSFATSLFGDAAKGMNISFDSSSISASSSFSGLLQHAEGSNGTSDSAALKLEDAADFIGKGTITTADGHSFSFEVEVHYESTLTMAASSTSTTQAAKSDGDSAPAHHQHKPAATRDGLAAHFPGSVADLFKMLDQGPLKLSWPGQANGNDDGGAKLGDLKLHLLNLLGNPHAMGQKLADAYGDLPSSGKVAEQA
ncbi:MAG TPA: hypothetical protein VN639_13220 [Azonexus sp.]|nr:hypothetical protein [Azonexus sp.]